LLSQGDSSSEGLNQQADEDEDAVAADDGDEHG